MNIHQVAQLCLAFVEDSGGYTNMVRAFIAIATPKNGLTSREWIQGLPKKDIKGLAHILRPFEDNKFLKGIEQGAGERIREIRHMLMDEYMFGVGKI